MQHPTEKTPVCKCVDLAAYASRMLSKFTANAVLVDLSARMAASGAALLAAQQAYEAAQRAILPARVDSKYIDNVSDRLLRRLQRQAEIADDRKGGPIATMVFPRGARALIRLRGASQVQAMIDLEGRLVAAQAMWPGAAAALAEVAQRRQEYKAAIDGRRAAGQAAYNLRALRNAEKQRFLSTYEEIANLARAQFPRDRDMQDLFFDDVRTPSTSQRAASDDDLPDDDAADDDAAPDDAASATAA